MAVARKLTPGHAKGAEIGFEAVHAEEPRARNGIVVGDAHKSAGVEEYQGGDEEED